MLRLLRLMPLKQVGSVMTVLLSGSWRAILLLDLIRSADAEAIVEEAKASAQNRFGHGALLVSIQRIRECDARSPSRCGRQYGSATPSATRRRA